MAQVFISYSSKDEAKARNIVNQLESAGFSCWIACRDIPVGGDFGKTIPPAIRNSPVFVLLLSQNSLESEDVYGELVLAKRNAQKKLIIPLMLEQCHPLDKEGFDYHLVNVQIREYYKNPNVVMKEVVQTIRGQTPPHGNQNASDKVRNDRQKETVSKTIKTYETLIKNYIEGTRNPKSAERSYLISNAGSAELEYLKGKSEFDSKKYKEAVRWFTKAANANHREAQYWLGYCYDWGKGVSQSRKTAAEWYSKAARQGSPEAMTRLGTFYQYGTGVQRSPYTAEDWFRKAAKLGYRPAIEKLR